MRLPIWTPRIRRRAEGPPPPTSRRPAGPLPRPIRRKWEQRLVDELGANVVDLSDEQLPRMAAKVRAEVWPQVLEDVGTEWGQPILDRIGN